jgi:hypothetical protein
LSRGREGEIERDGLGLHAGVRDLLHLGGVAADEDQVEAPTCEVFLLLLVVATI